MIICTYTIYTQFPFSLYSGIDRKYYARYASANIFNMDTHYVAVVLLLLFVCYFNFLIIKYKYFCTWRLSSVPFYDLSLSTFFLYFFFPFDHCTIHYIFMLNIFVKSASSTMSFMIIY